jgi:glycosyltransferase involved in cell wall biosynthesis
MVKMKIIMYFMAAGPDGNIEQKIQNWMNKRYRGDLMYGLTHFKENNLGVVFPRFKQYRSIERESWIPNLLEILKDKRKYDIVYSPYRSGNEALVYLRGLRFYRKKIVVWQHSPIEKPGGFFRTLLYRIFLNGIDKFIFFGENARTESLQSQLVSKNKTVVLNWGADLDFFNNVLKEASGQEYKDIRFISTGVDNRDFETLVKAFKGLAQKLDLYVVQKELYEKYKNTGENIRVHFSEPNGTLESSLISSYTVGLELAKSSVSIICSKPITNRKMSSGLTSLIEATALGKPVIITRNKYLPQYFEENNVGLFVNPANIEELRNAIIKISSDRELLRQLGENSRQFAVKMCNLELFTKDLAILLESI